MYYFFCFHSICPRGTKFLQVARGEVMTEATCPALRAGQRLRSPTVRCGDCGDVLKIAEILLDLIGQNWTKLDKSGHLLKGL